VELRLVERLGVLMEENILLAWRYLHMESVIHINQGRYFEEFEVGQKIVTPARTVTEGDIVTFAGLSGDYNQIHTDAEFGKGTPYGQRIAHGLLVLSIVSGLAMRTGLLEGTVLAFREINEWKFSKPTFIGDTVHVVLEVTETKALARLGGGLVTIKFDVKNQKDETVMKGSWSVLMALKP
jgi:3-hydroxybutyryl-CoA dehydratase